MSEHFEHHDRVEAAELDDAGAVAAGADPHRRPEPPTTGNPRVDDVLRSLDGIDRRPVDEHVEVFEAVHETLRAALAEAGDRQGSQAGS